MAEADKMRTISLDHITPPIGVYICDTDWALTAVDAWDGKKEDVLGIYVGDSTIKRVVWPEPVYGDIFSTNEQYYTVVTETTDYDGKKHTAKMKTDPKYTASSIAGLASAYTFKDGTEAYLPSAGEMRLVALNLLAVQTASIKSGFLLPFDITKEQVTFWTSFKYAASSNYWFYAVIVQGGDPVYIWQANKKEYRYGYSMCEY